MTSRGQRMLEKQLVYSSAAEESYVRLYFKDAVNKGNAEIGIRTTYVFHSDMTENINSPPQKKPEFVLINDAIIHLFLTFVFPQERFPGSLFHNDHLKRIHKSAFKRIKINGNFWQSFGKLQTFLCATILYMSDLTHFITFFRKQYFFFTVSGIPLHVNKAHACLFWLLNKHCRDNTPSKPQSVWTVRWSAGYF